MQRALEKLRGVLAKKGVMAGVGALGVVMAEKVTEAAPAGLVDTVVATVAAGAGGAGSAGVIAKGAIKMMAWAKVKVAAAWIAGVLVVGIGLNVRSQLMDQIPAKSGAKPVPVRTAPTAPVSEASDWQPRFTQLYRLDPDQAIKFIPYTIMPFPPSTRPNGASCRWA